MTAFTTVPGPPEPYGEWACLTCLPWEAGARDLAPETAQRQAREHAEQNGHGVSVITGTAQPFGVIAAEAAA